MRPHPARAWKKQAGAVCGQVVSRMQLCQCKHELCPGSQPVNINGWAASQGHVKQGTPYTVPGRQWFVGGVGVGPWASHADTPTLCAVVYIVCI